MRGLFHVACVLLVASPATLPAPDESPIELPRPAAVPAPMPPPDATVRLAPGSLYVIKAKVDCSARDYPKGVLKVTRKKGPRDITAKFWDGTGLVEDRTFDAPFLFVVEAVGAGAATLDVIPYGFKSDSQIVTVLFDAQKVIPVPPVPPDPPKPPPPDPKPKPAPLAAAWAIVVEETTARTPEIARVMGDTLYWKGLESRGVKFRFYDKDSPDVRAKNYDGHPAVANGTPTRILYSDELGLPYLLIIDKDGRKLKATKLPATTGGVDAILKGETP